MHVFHPRRFLSSSVWLLGGAAVLAGCGFDGAVVSGRLVEPDGTPVSGASVAFTRGSSAHSSSDALGIPQDALPYANATSDADGRFRLEAKSSDLMHDSLPFPADFFLNWTADSAEDAKTIVRFRLPRAENLELPELIRWTGQASFNASSGVLQVPAPPKGEFPPAGTSPIFHRRSVFVLDAAGKEAYRTELSDDGRATLPTGVSEDFGGSAFAVVRAEAGWPPPDGSGRSPDVSLELDQRIGPVALPASKVSVARGQRCSVNGRDLQTCFATDGKLEEVWFANNPFTLHVDLGASGVNARGVIVRGLALQNSEYDAVVETKASAQAVWQEELRIPGDALRTSFGATSFATDTRIVAVRVRSVLREGQTPSPDDSQCCSVRLAELSVIPP